MPHTGLEGMVGRMYTFRPRERWPADVTLMIDLGYEKHHVVVTSPHTSITPPTLVEVINISSHPPNHRSNDFRYIPIGFPSSEASKVPLRVGTAKLGHKTRFLKLPELSWVNLTSILRVSPEVLQPWYKDEWGEQCHLAEGEALKLVAEMALCEAELRRQDQVKERGLLSRAAELSSVGVVAIECR